MNLTRNGKIARLPLEVRELLNKRLQDGEQGKKLVEWLNSLEEVQAVMDSEFGGRPINEQNLTEWKQGGYRDWLALQEAREVMARLEEETEECDQGGPTPGETLARWLAARYAVATRRLLETEGPEQWRLLRELCGDVVALRRGDHSAERLEIEKKHLNAYERDVDTRKQSKLDAGLELLFKEVKRYPDAVAAVMFIGDVLNDRLPKAPESQTE